MGFVANSADPCLFIMVRNGIRIYLIVYVDDLLVACEREAEIKRVYEALRKKFEISWLGEAKHFLGLELQRGPDGVYSLGVQSYLGSLGVQSYIEKLVVKAGLENAKIAKTPMDQGFLKNTATNEVMDDSTKYRSTDVRCSVCKTRHSCKCVDFREKICCAY